jgi:hypothetical protein
MRRDDSFSRSDDLAIVTVLSKRGARVMPSKSAKQHRFMEVAAHKPAFAKKAGIPQTVAKEFVAADAAKAKRGAKAMSTGKKDG